MCRSSRPTSLYLPLPVFWSAPPTSGVCPTGRPAIPATGHSSLSVAPMGNLTYLCCSSQSWASPRNAQIPASGWAEGLNHLPPVALWSSALDVLSGASCLMGVPSSGLQKVTHLSSLCQFGEWTCLSNDLPKGKLLGCWHLVLSASLFSLSVFNSSM